MLTQYIQQTRRLLNDTNNRVYSDADLTAYINEARVEIASEGQCVRFLTPSSNGIASIAITSGGANYVAPLVVISPPDAVSPGTQATAVAVLSGTQVASVSITNAGMGYFNQPTITITDASGAGAAATATLLYTNRTVLAQEVYNFTSVTFPAGSGISEVLMVRSVALLWGTFRYLDMSMSFSKYQAFVRNYTSAYLYIPTVAAQYGQGQAGSIYMYPLPSQAYPMEWDCVCVPIDLASDSDVEAIPAPWTRCVKYFAGYLACFGSQRNEDSDRMLKYYTMFMRRARAFSQANHVNNWYGRS